jgi:hypothetical protein
MKIKLSVLFLSIILSSNISARDIENAERFVGLEVGASTIKADTGGLFGEDNVEGSDVEYGVRIGAQNKDWRTILSLSQYDNKESDQNFEKGEIGFDYYLLTSQFQTTSFRPYLGVHGGYMNYESTQIDEDGFFYGGQAGFTLGVGDKIDVDLAYKYSLTDIEEVDNIGSLNIGINYLY